MAARKRTTTRTTRSGVVVVTPPAPSRRSPRRVTKRRAPVRRRGGYYKYGGGDSAYKNRLMSTAIGGLAYGILEKSFGDKLPTLPFLGRSGTVAMAVYFFGGPHTMIKDLGIAAAAIAGYSLGGTGKIAGEYDEHGFAAEL